MSNTTREKLLLEATHLMCKNGYSAFSYADLSHKIGISKASIHHHFSTKETLAKEVIDAAYAQTQQILALITAQFSQLAAQLEQYMLLFSDHHQYSRLPLCCSLSSEYANLPESIQVLTQDYFQLQIDWLNQILISAKAQQQIAATVNTEDMALMIMKLCEGSSILSRVLNKPELFAQTLQQILQLFGLPK